MPSDRRTLLRRTAVGITAVLAGCLDRNGPSDGNGTDDGTDGGNGDSDDERPTVESSDTLPLVSDTSRPWWDDENGVGHAILVDDEERQRAALEWLDLSESQREKVRTFLSGIDYATERALLVESVGPNACYDRLEIDSIRVEDGTLLADAAISEPDASMGCAEVITFPSAIARIAFDGTPPDAATIEVTDGWEETTTVRADIDDPIP
jgi:hypothetical protein